MTSFGSVGQAAQAMSFAGQAKALPGLAEKWREALQQKEPQKLGSILGEVKGLGIKAEKAFLAAVATKEETVSGSAMSLGESISAKLSLDQRAEVAKELFAIKGFKGHLFSKASLESKLAKYLAQMGKEKAGGAVTRDEMVRERGLAERGGSIFEQVADETAATALPPDGGGGHSPEALAALEQIRQRGGCWGRALDPPELKKE